MQCSMRGAAVGVLIAGLSTGLAALSLSPARAADAKDPNALVEKAIAAAGGAEKLGKVKAASWTGKGTLHLMGSENALTLQFTTDGPDHWRQEAMANVGGMDVKLVVVVNGDKGWLGFNGQFVALEKDRLANQKREAALEVLPRVLVPLKSKDYKLEASDVVVIDGKPADGIKVTPQDGKEFSLYFDRESGLPVRSVARVLDFQGQEYTREANYSSFKEVAGLKLPQKVEVKRDGEKFIDQEISDFKLLDSVEAQTFAEPK
jgi:hypothetical protein